MNPGMERCSVMGTVGLGFNLDSVGRETRFCLLLLLLSALKRIAVSRRLQ